MICGGGAAGLETVRRSEAAAIDSDSDDMSDIPSAPSQELQEPYNQQAGFSSGLDPYLEHVLLYSARPSRPTTTSAVHNIPPNPFKTLEKSRKPLILIEGASRTIHIELIHRQTQKVSTEQVNEQQNYEKEQKWLRRQMKLQIIREWSAPTPIPFFDQQTYYLTLLPSTNIQASMEHLNRAYKIAPPPKNPLKRHASSNNDLLSKDTSLEELPEPAPFAHPIDSIREFLSTHPDLNPKLAEKDEARVHFLAEDNKEKENAIAHKSAEAQKTEEKLAAKTTELQQVKDGNKELREQTAKIRDQDRKEIRDKNTSEKVKMEQQIMDLMSDVCSCQKDKAMQAEDPGSLNTKYMELDGMYRALEKNKGILEQDVELAKKSLEELQGANWVLGSRIKLLKGAEKKLQGKNEVSEKERVSLEKEIKLLKDYQCQLQGKNELKEENGRKDQDLATSRSKNLDLERQLQGMEEDTKTWAAGLIAEITKLEKALKARDEEVGRIKADLGVSVNEAEALKGRKTIYKDLIKRFVAEMGVLAVGYKRLETARKAWECEATRFRDSNVVLTQNRNELEAKYTKQETLVDQKATEYTVLWNKFLSLHKHIADLQDENRNLKVYMNDMSRTAQPGNPHPPKRARMEEECC
ncbi:hypothetical protein B7494_g4000 [Chlorociboria aeruginascens]|nr:hypothetical protein B7494_g4000 [Chlorociboria aeruginascens]